MLCFVHIPKAGGTTLNFVLQRGFGHHFLAVEPWVDIRRILSPADLTLLQKWMPWVSHISSHYVRAYSGLEAVSSNIRYITVLREPLARCISDYYHLKNVNHRVANFYEYLNNEAWANKQTKYIAGSVDVERAKAILLEKFHFVGLVEQMDESLVMMKKLLDYGDLDICYGAPKNVARRKGSPQKARDSWQQFKAQILENNAADIELYRFVIEEIYPAQQERYGPSLAQDVAAFKQANDASSAKPSPAYQLSRFYYKTLLTLYRREGIKHIRVDNGADYKEYDIFGEYVF